MSATPSRLQLNSYYLKELSYFLKDSLEKPPTKKTDSKNVELEISDFTTQMDADGREWRCELTIKSTNPEKRHFYDFRIVLVGFFTVSEGLDKETAILIAETNAPAELYSTSREIVATVTRRSPYPGTLLPTVTFVKEPVAPSIVKKPTKPKQKK